MQRGQRKEVSVARLPKREVEPETAEEPEPEAPTPSFFIRTIQLEGSQMVTRQELTPFISPYEGREVTLDEARALASKIEDVYYDKGYVTTKVIIPPQTIVAETLKIQILEGKVGKLSLEGLRWFPESSLTQYWTLKEGQPLSDRKLLRAVRRMNEHPDRRVRIILKPGEPAHTDVYLKVKDRFPLHGRFAYDNKGVRSTGKQRFQFMGSYGNAIIADGTLVVGTIFGTDFGAVVAQSVAPVGPYGTKVLFGFAHSQADPKREFERSDINGHSQTYSIGVTQPILEKDRFVILGNVGFDLKDSRTKDTSGTRRRDRIRVIGSGFTVTESDRFGGAVLANNVFFGTPLFGATGDDNRLASREGTPAHFIKYGGVLTRRVRLPFKTEALFHVEGQWSLNKLVPQEQQYLGGADTVRGYPNGDYLADQGIFFSFEYLLPFFVVPDNWQFPGSKRSLREDFQLVAFSDQAYGRLRGAASDETRTRYLFSVGGGLRVRLHRFFVVRLEAAHAFGDEPLTDSDHTRLHFTLQTSF